MIDFTTNGENSQAILYQLLIWTKGKEPNEAFEERYFLQFEKVLETLNKEGFVKGEGNTGWYKWEGNEVIQDASVIDKTLYF